MNPAYGQLPAPRTPPGFVPGGRLTLVARTPVISSDQTAKTVLYYTPFVHAYFPVIKNGVVRDVYFGDADLLLTLTSAHGSSTIYDVFGVEGASGKGKLLTGVSWSNSAAGVGDRGSGGGTSELIFGPGGVRVNKYGMPGLNAEGSAYIPPLEGTYLGSIFVDGSAGQLSCHVSWGQSRKWAVWNAHNRKRIFIKAGDSTASWIYTSTSNRASNNNTNNAVTAFMGMPEEMLDVQFRQKITMSTATVASVTVSATGGIVRNSVLSVGFKGYAQDGPTANTAGNQMTGGGANLAARAIEAPFLGVNNYISLESGIGANTTTWFGTEDNMLLTAEWWG